jgi:hypothetical protein
VKHPTKVITLKTQTNAVNARRKRLSQLSFKNFFFQFLADPSVKMVAYVSDTTSVLVRTGSAGLIVGIERVLLTAKTAGFAQCRTTFASVDKDFTELDVTKSKFSSSKVQSSG